VIIGLVLLNGTIRVVDYPISMPIGRWLIFSLLFAVIFRYKLFKNQFNSFPFKRIIIVLILGSLSIAIFDSRLSLFEKFYSPFREITDTYFILFLGYFTIQTKEDFSKFFKPLFIVLVIITIYGIFNFGTQANPYYEWVVNNFFVGGEKDMQSMLSALDTTKSRYRATSTFSMTFNYGYVSSLLALLFFYKLKVMTKSKLNAFLGVIFGAIGAFLSFSRTVLLTLIMGLFTNYFYSNNVVRIKYFFILLVSGILSYSFVPVIQTSVDNTFDIFLSGGDKAGGSSLEMRQVQFIGASKYFIDSPILGNGYDYINKELGWGDRDNAVLDEDMYGFESIIYQLMIEQGIVGLGTKLLFFISLIVFFLKRMQKEKALASLGLSIVVLFLTFSIGTGPLGAWPITMLLLGVIIKTIVLKEKGA